VIGHPPRPSISFRWLELANEITPPNMKIAKYHKSENGSGGGYLLLWLLGVPFPVLLVIFLLRGCS
jgi:hypothetical protein